MHRDHDMDAAFRTDEQGQTMAEYSVVLGVITVVIMAAVVLLGDTVAGLIQDVVSMLP
jgi:Flp pilus assembly pilin Flp